MSEIIIETRTLTKEYVRDEFHVTVPHLNLSRSLRFLFDAPQ